MPKIPSWHHVDVSEVISEHQVVLLGNCGALQLGWVGVCRVEKRWWWWWGGGGGGGSTGSFAISLSCDAYLHVAAKEQPASALDPRRRCYPLPETPTRGRTDRICLV